MSGKSFVEGVTRTASVPSYLVPEDELISAWIWQLIRDPNRGTPSSVGLVGSLPYAPEHQQEAVPVLRFRSTSACWGSLLSSFLYQLAWRITYLNTVRKKNAEIHCINLCKQLPAVPPFRT